ncbi:MAG: glycosyl transferase family 2 [Bacillota bacterium]|nr:glycosyl transferase family 2 [Bacillota bacterium]
MHHGSALPEEVARRVAALKKADIVIGIPSYNNSSTIGQVAAAAAAGAATCFPGLRAVLLNSDGRSTDGTQGVVLAQELPPGVESLAFTYAGLPGKGSALRAIFEVTVALDATACVVVDSDLRSIRPDWIGRLAGPVFEGYDFVAPYYVRHKHDATITNTICYPLTRALYGLRVRQPIGGDFGFSGALARRYLAKDVWSTDVARFGVDIFMTTTAVVESGEVVQAALGAKVHDAKDPGSDLGPMFRQVVSTLFGMICDYEAVWKNVTGSRPVEVRGAADIGPVEPEQVPIDERRLVEAFRAGRRTCGHIWEAVLGRAALSALDALVASQDPGLPADLWVDIVYGFAKAYCQGAVDRASLVQALSPLYNGRIAAFAREARHMTSVEAEALVERQSILFEQKKPEFVRAWDTCLGRACLGTAPGRQRRRCR